MTANKIKVRIGDPRKGNITETFEVPSFQLACDIESALLEYYDKIRQVETEKHNSDFHYSIQLFDKNGNFAAGQSV